jgi:hypothetical protein
MMMVQTRLKSNSLYFIVATVLSLPCVGQTLSISGTVMKTGSSEVLPFVTIAVQGTTRGTITDEQGHFTLETNADDSVIFSSVGFIKIIVPSKQVGDTTYLDEESKLLNEVVVSSTKRMKKIDIGNLKDKTVVATGGANQYAKLFANEVGSEGVLESLVLNFQPEAKKYGRYMTSIMIHVYQNAKGLPGADVLLEKVIVPIKENQKVVSVELSKYGIVFPAEGLFVGLDFIGYYDDAGIFSPYSRLKTPANLRIEFASAESADTFSKFFGTSWRKVLHSDRDGRKNTVSAKFGIRVSY